VKEKTYLEDRNGWNNGKEIDIKEIRLKNVDYIHLRQNRLQREDFEKKNSK